MPRDVAPRPPVRAGFVHALAATAVLALVVLAVALGHGAVEVGTREATPPRLVVAGAPTAWAIDHRAVLYVVRLRNAGTRDVIVLGVGRNRVPGLVLVDARLGGHAVDRFRLARHAQAELRLRYAVHDCAHAPVDRLPVEVRARIEQARIHVVMLHLIARRAGVC